MKKFTLIVIAFTFFFQKNIAQFSVEWTANYQHTTANGYSNESRKVVTDVSGNSYVLADVTSNKDPNGIVTTSTWHYTVLTKYNSLGVLQTAKAIKVNNHMVSGFDNNGAFGLEIDDNNDLYIGYLDYDAASNFNVVIAKYKTNMLLQWERVYNPTSVDAGVGMVVNNGAVYALVRCISGAGTTYRVISASSSVTNDTSLYSFTLNTDVINAIAIQKGAIGSAALYTTGYRIIAGYKSALAVKLNLLGSLKWVRTFDAGIPGDDYGKNAAFGVDGFVYFTGSSWRGSPNNFDVLIWKIAPNGTIAWTKFRDNNHFNDVGLFVQANNPNYVYVGSTSANNVVFDQIETFLGNAGGKAVYSPVPIASYAYLSGIELNDFKVSTNHGFYLCGSVFATDAQGRLYSAEFLAKYVFPTPNIRNSFVLDSSMPVSGDYANSKSGTSIYLDYFKSDVYWLTDRVSDNGNHNQEKVVLRDLSMISPLRETADANTQISAAAEISITPNPAKDDITITSAEKITKVELFDITGKTVRSVVPGNEKTIMDISGLMKGIYIGKIYTVSGIVTSKKIIKN